MKTERLNVQGLVRGTHEQRVLEALRTYGPLDRASLERLTGISRTTLSAIARHLLSVGALVEVNGRESTRRDPGRPPTRLTLNPSGGVALGLELNHRSVHVVIANTAHEIIAGNRRAIGARTPWAGRVETALEMVDELAASSSVSLDALQGVGVGVVGPVEESAGLPRPARSDRIQLVHRVVEERFKVPVYVDTSPRLAALAEAIWGGGRGYRHVIYVRLSEGVGGGLVIDGQLFAGGTGASGQFGHVCVDPHGPPCRCGGNGCLGKYASIGAVLKRCRSRSLENVLQRLESGDREVEQIITQVGRQLGQVLAASCNIVNPEVVIVGGELASAGDVLLEPAFNEIQQHTHRRIQQALELRTAELDDSAAARGGVALVLRESTMLAGYPSTARP